MLNSRSIWYSKNWKRCLKKKNDSLREIKLELEEKELKLERGKLEILKLK